MKNGFTLGLAALLTTLGSAAIAEESLFEPQTPSAVIDERSESAPQASPKGERAIDTARPVVARASATELDGDDLAVDELLKISNQEAEDLRLAAVEVLAELSSTRARAVLGVILYSNSMPTVRAAAADKLGDFGDGEALYALALALEMERDAEVRDVIAANLERNLPVDEEAPVKVVQPLSSLMIAKTN